MIFTIKVYKFFKLVFKFGDISPIKNKCNWHTIKYIHIIIVNIIIIIIVIAAIIIIIVIVIVTNIIIVMIIASFCKMLF